ncbi:cytochrome c oxidase subunit II [Nakamurella sp. PAMC28650]|uniref:aa3-type cytochrome oxidase subunit II n=1 Tax=Nakamurella sp. PAMC28650 TaxID=2762325 RepID=UPI00164ED380|nr:cytochrome c oxidase subunit II [Nakamurella sp. PAMC28650]QNK79609.1 cytochrome c oxidase subunit II [Nakamurella sp. PAMC28650]
MARSRSTRQLLLVGSLALAGLLVSGCSADDLPRFGWPTGQTPQALRMQHFWSWTFIAALCIGVGVWGLMFWTFAFHRKKKNSPLYPKQTKENLPLELVYTAVPFVMVAVLFYFAVTTENFVLKKVAHPDVNVNVTAFKWGWDFSYEGTIAPDSQPCTAIDPFACEVHTTGTATEVPIMILPVQKTIQYRLQSKDVIHSFWVPDFLFKRDVFPDPAANNTDNTFQNSITNPIAMVGRCAELCGTYHSSMNFEVRGVPQNVYDEYIKLRESKNPASGKGYTTAEALMKTGNDIPSCGKLCSPLSTTTYPINPNREAKSASLNTTGN